ncbi:uncharacterized protein SPSK_10208 [Sporothrix schenckii 1099-18]|uniref:Uncharacterized protein n=1 Tax=Sporothrix schenckii 1099-18 TaxID=1397361 RepID=A0A0F2MAJ2_SPOSC|nr:uncharacterized protein SPSK_10208 [Sporothrix schenckii 1099-18]KJR85181.1 hypothetical protein SPSK_10208 [Sporothrix schenckii 1099-18]
MGRSAGVSDDVQASASPRSAPPPAALFITTSDGARGDSRKKSGSTSVIVAALGSEWPANKGEGHGWFLDLAQH